ncbi:hypothetical protein NOR_01367 [Metarhizium rileyi]|uniref:Uncharacterized protein n=1 Tax=Metarhizium rileyi (strain RCEF 4871) TaxID=1649241 RepID=A0A162KDA9_METRR|nr:hypothetical protein NOR_01367 [Metarhizium rileyi RCEF 4871]
MAAGLRSTCPVPWNGLDAMLFVTSASWQMQASASPRRLHDDKVTLLVRLAATKGSRHDMWNRRQRHPSLLSSRRGQNKDYLHASTIGSRLRRQTLGTRNDEPDEV